MLLCTDLPIQHQLINALLQIRIVSGHSSHFMICLLRLLSSGDQWAPCCRQLPEMRTCPGPGGSSRRWAECPLEVGDLWQLLCVTMLVYLWRISPYIYIYVFFFPLTIHPAFVLHLQHHLPSPAALAPVQWGNLWVWEQEEPWEPLYLTPLHPTQSSYLSTGERLSLYWCRSLATAGCTDALTAACGVFVYGCYVCTIRRITFIISHICCVFINIHKVFQHISVTVAMAQPFLFHTLTPPCYGNRNSFSQQRWKSCWRYPLEFLIAMLTIDCIFHTILAVYLNGQWAIALEKCWFSHIIHQ